MRHATKLKIWRLLIETAAKAAGGAAGAKAVVALMEFLHSLFQ